MRRSLIAAAAMLACASVAGLPAQAAPPKAKPKPKPITGSYSVQLPPDPSANVGSEGCAGLLFMSQDLHAFTIPAKGTLKLRLSSADPTGQLDWDLALLDEGGAAIAMSTSPSSEEQVVVTFKKKEKVQFQACNVNGQPDATITYTFTYT